MSCSDKPAETHDAIIHNSSSHKRGKMLDRGDLKTQLIMLLEMTDEEAVSALATAQESTRSSILAVLSLPSRQELCPRIAAFQALRCLPFIIPEELKSMIFGYLSVGDLKAISEVCQSLRESVARTLFNTLTIRLNKGHFERAKERLESHTYRRYLRVLRFKFPYHCGEYDREYCTLLEDVSLILSKARELSNRVTVILESGNAIKLFNQDHKIGQTLLIEGKQRGFKLSLEHFSHKDTSVLLRPIAEDGLLSIELLRIPIHSLNPRFVGTMPSIHVNNLIIDTAPNILVDSLLRVIENIKEPRTISIDGCSFDEASMLANTSNWQSLSSCTLRCWTTETVAWYDMEGSMQYINKYSIDEKSTIHLIEPWPAHSDYNRHQRDQAQRVGQFNAKSVIDEIAWRNNEGWASNLEAAYVFLDWCYAQYWQWTGQEVFGLPEVRVRVKKTSGGTQWLTLFDVCNAVGQHRTRREIRQMLEARLSCWEMGTGMQLGLHRHRRFGIVQDFAYYGVDDPTPYLTYD
jgi:hypothetical protein